MSVFAPRRYADHDELRASVRRSILAHDAQLARHGTLMPLLAWTFAIAFTSSCITLALSALVTSPHTGPGEGSSVPAAADPDVASAVRASALPRGEAAPVPVFTTQESATSSVVPAARAHQHSEAEVLAIIRNAAVEFGVDAGDMIAVARCESSLNELAVGDGGDALGLFQWHRGPFLQHARELFHADVVDLRTDPVVASLVTAFTVSRQGWGIWSCKP